MRQLVCIALLHLVATVVWVHSDVESDCAGKPADVVFLLDASNSIWQPDFKRQLNFIRDVVAFFTIGPRNMLVGVITYADYPRLQFHLNSYNRKSDLFAAIDNIRRDGGYETRTSASLRYLRERAFSETFGARPRMAQQVAVIITDGRSDNTTLTALEAAKVKAAGIHLFAVGVGRNLDMAELRLLASDPIDYYTFLVDSYGGLERIKDLLAIKTCAVTDPPTTTTTTTTTTPSTTTITTTTTRRQRRLRTTTMKPTAPTTSESTTTSSASNRNDSDENDDDYDKIKRGGSYTEDDSDLTDSKDFGPPESMTHNASLLTGKQDLNHLGESSVTAGQNDLNPSDKDIDGDSPQIGNTDSDSPRTGNNLDRAGGDKTGGGGIDGSQSESGKDSDDRETSERISGTDGTGSRDPESGQDTSSGSDGKGSPNRPTIRYETPRTLDFLHPPLYLPDSTQYPYHELQGKNSTYRTHPTSEHDAGDGGLEKDRRPNRRPGGHSTELDGGNPSSQGRELGIYRFDGDGRFQRIDGSESLVDVDRLPKIPEDGRLFTEGGLILFQDPSGRRRIVGCEVNGTLYVGQWTAENGTNWFHGYRAPEIADRLGNGPRHVIQSAEHRIADDTTDGDDVIPDGDDVTWVDANVAEYRALLPNSSNPSRTGYDGDQVLDPNGNFGYWNEERDGRTIWYLYTCPGIYVPVPDGLPFDENGKPRLNGQSQCTVPDDEGQDVDYLYDPTHGRFERVIPPSSSSGVVPAANKDDNRFFEVRGTPEERREDDTTGESNGGFLENVEINGKDGSGVWTVDVDWSLTPIRNELVDLNLPKIDEDQEFYIRENVIWVKVTGGRLKPVGCIINGTYYVGYFIRKDDGTRLLYGYPSKTLQQKLDQRQPTELTHRMLRERPPTIVEQNGDGRWIVDDRGELHWIRRVSDDAFNEKLELRIDESQTPRKIGSEDAITPSQDSMEYTTTTPENAAIGGRVTVLDSNGQTGTWRRDQGEWVWYRYVCPGIYVPASEVSPTASSTENGCTATDENGELAEYVYQGPGTFVKIPKESDAGEDKDYDETTKTRTRDSNDKRDKEGRDSGDNRTKGRSTQAPPGSDPLHRKPTSTPFHFETDDKSSSHRGCRPRKPTDLAFIVDSKRDDETSADQMWNLTREILAKLDLDDDRVQVRFVQECGPGSSGLNLGEFDTKESLISALDARIHEPPTSSAQLIRNMADALSRNGRGRRRVGVYLTDGASDSIEETLAAAQDAKHENDVEMFAVGVGPGTKPTELRAIASCEVDRHYYAMNHHSKADAIAKKISKVICLGR